MQQKPTLVNVIAWTTLASGVVNIIWGLAASGTAFATVIGIICTPITILPTVLGIFEILYAAKLLGNPPQVVKPSTNIAILEIVCVLAGNIFAMVVGILSLVFYNDQIVKDYFDRLNGIVPFAPALPVESVPPAPSEEPVPPTEPTVPAPEPPENPETPDIPDPS